MKSRGNRLNRKAVYIPNVEGDFDIVFPLFMPNFTGDELPFSEIKGKPRSITFPKQLKVLPKFDMTNFKISGIYYEYDGTTPATNLSTWNGGLINVFYNMSELQEINLFNMDKMQIPTNSYFLQIFSGCSNLKTINGFHISPNVMQINGDTFNCALLEKINFEKTTQIGASGSYGYMDFSKPTNISDDTSLDIAFYLADGPSNSSALKFPSAKSSIANVHIRLNESGDGLENCNAGDSGDLGTLSQYITNKGWTLTFA